MNIMIEKCLKYSVCLDAIYHDAIKNNSVNGTDMNFARAMDEVAGMGYDAIEFWSWRDKDIEAVRSASKSTGLEIAAFCSEFIEPGDITLQKDYLEGIKRACDTAHILECSTIIVQAGWEFETAPRGITRQEHRRTLVDTLRKAGEVAESDNIQLVVEPLNVLVNHPGYHLSTTLDAVSLIDDIGLKNVKILFDIYHQQITEGNLTDNILQNIAKIGHFHMAQVPGRGPLYEGEINYPYILSKIADNSYKGYIGIEYTKASDPATELEKCRNELI